MLKHLHLYFLLLLSFSLFSQESKINFEFSLNPGISNQYFRTKDPILKTQAQDKNEAGTSIFSPSVSINAFKKIGIKSEIHTSIGFHLSGRRVHHKPNPNPSFDQIEFHPELLKSDYLHHYAVAQVLYAHQLTNRIKFIVGPGLEYSIANKVRRSIRFVNGGISTLKQNFPQDLFKRFLMSGYAGVNVFLLKGADFSYSIRPFINYQIQSFQKGETPWKINNYRMGLQFVIQIN